MNINVVSMPITSPSIKLRGKWAIVMSPDISDLFNTDPMVAKKLKKAGLKVCAKK